MAATGLAADSSLQQKENVDGSFTITLSPEQYALCKSGGGCVVMPLEDMKNLILRQAALICGKTI